MARVKRVPVATKKDARVHVREKKDAVVKAFLRKYRWDTRTGKSCNGVSMKPLKNVS
jgi:hypothetical protein